LTQLGWNGFAYLQAHEIRYASNGVAGMNVVHRKMQDYNTTDTLALLMQDTVFSAHLTYDADTAVFALDLSAYEHYIPLPGSAPMGGHATLVYDATLQRLKTTSLTYQGVVYHPSDTDAAVNAAWVRSKLVGWKYAEKCILASLMGLTNLVLHVKDLHLELAAAFQAVTIDRFAHDVTHPIRRLTDPYIHRAIQATNDNMKLLFLKRAAEWSLAPLPVTEQLRLIDDAVRDRPLYLANLDMENYGAVRGMPVSGAQAPGWFWRWHYRALTVQRLYAVQIECHLTSNGYHTDQDLQHDPTLVAWWTALGTHIPALDRSLTRNTSWAGRQVSRTGLIHVLRTLFTWLSWIHEDVGHSAAAFVYNPVQIPMQVPLDGEGVPLTSFLFNTAAYRGFVFLDRAKLLDTPPPHWFDAATGDQVCFTAFQTALQALGATDIAFQECDTTGYYSCVHRVETSVSS
jgi:hypothetical protein